MTKTILKKFKKEIKKFIRNEFGKENPLCFIYGSYSYGLEKKNSDIDLIIIKEKTSRKIVKMVANKVIELHEKYGLAIDNEVPHEVKTITDMKDVKMALKGKGFKSDGKRIIIPKVKKTKKFLSSKEIKRRLILNALTSKGIFVCGNKKLYAWLKEEAFRTIIKVIILNKNLQEFSIKDLINLMISNNYPDQELYLGYKDKSIIKKSLKKSLEKSLNDLGKKKILKKNKNKYEIIKPEWFNEML